MICNGVFEGGGVKGIGLVGAVCAMEDAGYKFENVAGTSAGSIVASLLSVGYTGREIKDEMIKLDFSRLKGQTLLTHLGLPGKAIKLLLKNGVYDADYIRVWLEALLHKKNITRFGEIRAYHTHGHDSKYRFQAIASDLSGSRMLVLPRDLHVFGLAPDKFSIATAVRMSISIPVFYEPYILTDSDGKSHVIVDGGLLSNYPIWVLDNRKTNPIIPTFGFKFSSSTSEEPRQNDYNSVLSISDFTKAMIRTLLDAHDKHYISVSRGDFQRTITISTIINKNDKEHDISSVDFNISTEDMEALFDNGYRSAEKFLRTWDFDKWKRQYRNETFRTAS
ncbi:MAG: patatin-like phospholipase family protein [Clostridiales bacterium]|jgi:NTE family protein|nr:patatin-like phospholipase family protein [Clostridiales bacterium]